MRNSFQTIPAIDLLRGQAVRLRQGDFRNVTTYGDPLAIASSWQLARGSMIHVVDLDASRTGRATESANVRRLVAAGYAIQVGGGIRSANDAKRWIDCGASRVVTGTIAANDEPLLDAIARAIGPDRLVIAADVSGDVVKTDGWTVGSSTSIESIVQRAERLGIAALLVTDIQRDGMINGPSLELYRRLARSTAIPLIASGGIGSAADVVACARSGAAGVVIGRALLDKKITFDQIDSALRDRRPPRVIACLDIRGGRVVKGVSFQNLRDAGDPVDCAQRYENEGADELVVLDVSATDDERVASLATVRAIAESLFIPLTVGGGVRDVESFRSLLAAGADRVAINSAAVRDPMLIARSAREFGSQAVVLACDALLQGNSYRVVTRSGRNVEDLDAVSWCREAAELGAGEILLTSVDADGRQSGFDLELVRRVSSTLPVGVIASGGAGRAAHFRDAIDAGASAVLAASTFHDRLLSIAEVKSFLRAEGIDSRVEAGGIS